MRSIIQKAENFDSNSLYIMREDLLPHSFGGNKLRIALKYYEDMLSKGYDSIIVYGKLKSNLCRSMAAVCSVKKINCSVIYCLEENDKTTLNFLNTQLYNTEIFYCNISNVSNTIKNVIKQQKDKGYKPYYVFGNEYGEGNEATPVKAYHTVYSQIKEFEKTNQINFDYIFLATGTGMTQSGLIAGALKYKETLKIVGFSIAWEKEKCVQKITKYLEAFFGVLPSFNINVEDYCKGNIYSKQIEETILKQMRENGLPLDIHYTGKSFFSMEKFIAEKKIENKNLLFIHTGGTPLFFDWIDENFRFEYENFKHSKFSSEDLYHFILQADDDYLSKIKHIDLKDYVAKLVKKANIFIAVKKNHIQGMIAFYKNYKEREFFVSLVLINKKCQGKGVAKHLFCLMDKDEEVNSFDTIKLKVREDNFKALRFYEKLGFTFNDYDKDDKTRKILIKKIGELS